MAKQSHAREEENTKKSRIPNPVQSLHHLHPRRIGTKNSQETTPKQRECEPTKSLGKDRIPHKTHKVGDHRSLRACSTKGAGEWARYHSPIRCTLYCYPQRRRIPLIPFNPRANLSNIRGMVFDGCSYCHTL
jgi:hypothetical protein